MTVFQHADRQTSKGAKVPKASWLATAVVGSHVARLLAAGFSFSVLLSGGRALAADYYVDASSSGGDGQSTETAFTTISECVDRVGPGDVCLVTPGTYREEVSITASGTADSPITLRALEPGKAVVSSLEVIEPGAEGVGEWEKVPVNGRTVYRIVLPEAWDRGRGKNQVFFDGELQITARWPNVDDPVDISRATYAISTAGGVISETSEGHLSYYEHPQLKSIWSGAGMVLGSGGEWNYYATNVEESSDSRLTFVTARIDGDLDDDPYTPAADDAFYLWGKLEALDADGEWYFDANGEYGVERALYFLPAEGSPADGTLEMKRRSRTLSVDGSHLVIEGLALRGGKIELEDGTHNVALRDLTVEYSTHRLTGPVGAAVEIRGTNHVLEDSVVRYAAWHGVRTRGDGHILENNVIHHIGYLVDGVGYLTDKPAQARTTDCRLSNNTVFATAGAGMSLQLLARCEVARNHVFMAARTATDIAGINTGSGGDAEGTTIHRNLVHDVHGYYVPDSDHEGGRHNGGMGIRVDNGGSSDSSRNWIIRHNVVFNVSQTAIALWGMKPGVESYPNADLLVYNNTGINGFRFRWVDGNGVAGLDVRNNLFEGGCGRCSDLIDAGAVVRANLFSEEEVLGNLHATPRFADPLRHDYRLQSAQAPGIDEGESIPPYTDNAQGKPDLGAYEWGMLDEPPRYGASVRPRDLPSLGIDCVPQDSGTWCTVQLPLGRSIPPGFKLTVQGVTSERCIPTLDAHHLISTAECFIPETLEEGTATAEASLDGVGATPVAEKVEISSPRPICSRDAWTLPVELNGAAGDDLSSRPISFVLDTATLIEQGRLAEDCSNLRVRNQNLSRDHWYWIEPDTCNTERTRVWALGRPGTRIGGRDDVAAVHVQVGHPRWQSQSDRSRLFPTLDVPKRLWLRPESIATPPGGAVSEWRDDERGIAATQDDASRQPLSVAGHDGKPASLQFDGVDDELIVSDSLGSGEVTAFVAFRADPSAAEKYPRALSLASPGKVDWDVMALTSTTDEAGYPLAAPLGESRWKHAEEVGGAQLAIGGRADDKDNNHFAGEIAEVIVFDRRIEWRERNEVVQYLKVKHRTSTPMAKALIQLDALAEPCDHQSLADQHPEDPERPLSSSELTSEDEGIGASEGDQQCGCRVPGRAPSGSGWVISAMGLGLALLGARRGSRSRCRRAVPGS